MTGHHIPHKDTPANAYTSDQGPELVHPDVMSDIHRLPDAHTSDKYPQAVCPAIMSGTNGLLKTKEGNESPKKFSDHMSGTHRFLLEMAHTSCNF